jgi:putative redox protein
MAEQTTGVLTWLGGTRFEARSGSGHALLTESVARPGHQGPSPIELFLLGIGGCTAIDVAAILEKMREPVTGIAVELRAERAETHPKYFTAVEITYRVMGSGVNREKVERAVGLSHSAYCSAVASLRPDCAVTSAIVIETEPVPAGATI